MKNRGQAWFSVHGGLAPKVPVPTPIWAEPSTRKPRLSPFFSLCAALLLSSCSCEPDFVDCSLRCGAKNACPEGLECQAGFCRQKGAPGACICRPGETRACGSSVGDCSAGTETCGADRTWGACIGEGIPSIEICDARDNDCNGTVDDNPTDALPCEKKVGVCAGKRHACINGQYLISCSAAEYGAEYQATGETRCDGLDNDCDGRTDALAPRRLGNAGQWVLVGFDGGYGLVSTRPGGSGWLVEGALYDANLNAIGTTVQLATGTGTLLGLTGVARDDRAVATWTVQSVDGGPQVPDGIEWSRLVPATPSRLAGLPPAGERGTGNFVVGMPAVGIVGAHLLDDGGAALLTWTAGSLPPSVGPFAVPGLDIVQVDALSVSREALAARWVGLGFTDAGTPQLAGVVGLVGGRTSGARPSGQMMERTGALQAAWLESILQGVPTPRNESLIAVQYDVWDGGTFVLRTLPDYRAISSFSATQAQSALLIAWVESNQLVVGTPAGGTMIRTAQPFDGGVSAVGVASNGTPWNVVGWNGQNGMNAMLVCSP